MNHNYTVLYEDGTKKEFHCGKNQIQGLASNWGLDNGHGRIRRID